MTEEKDELAFLESVYHTYTVDTSAQTNVMRRLALKTFCPHINGGRALELGCSDGFMTSEIASMVTHLDVVDGSKAFLAKARERNIENVKMHFGLFENYDSEHRYDHIIASYILEHVANPVQILKNCARLLAPAGKVYVVVPNARALSRQLAQHMGLLSGLKDLTENDHNHGHRRVYDRASLNADIEQAGLCQIQQGGLMLKILADFQMDKLLDDNFLTDTHVNGLYNLGLEYPDLSGSLFAICSNF